MAQIYESVHWIHAIVSLLFLLFSLFVYFDIWLSVSCRSV